MAKPFGHISRILAPLSEIIEKLKERRALLEDQKRSVEAEIELIEGELARLNGGHGRAKKGERAEPDKRGRGKRVRRTRDQVEAHAGQIVDYIRSKGKEGVSGREIKAKFGAVLPTVQAYLKQYAPDAKIKTEGKKAAMRYLA
jgi:hypothetical protein